MTTTRSRNKLERKAHMNIHNTIEVVEGELHPDACFTRDRFGKKQLIRKEDHSFRRAKCVMAFLMLGFSTTTFAAVSSAAGSKNTNVQIESQSRDIFDSLDEREEKSRVTFYTDGNASMDINESGEPNLNMRF